MIEAYSDETIEAVEEARDKLKEDIEEHMDEHQEIKGFVTHLGYNVMRTADSFLEARTDEKVKEKSE